MVGLSSRRPCLRLRVHTLVSFFTLGIRVSVSGLGIRFFLLDVRVSHLGTLSPNDGPELYIVFKRTDLKLLLTLSSEVRLKVREEKLCLYRH